MSRRKDLGLNISNAFGVALAYVLLVFINMASPMTFYTLQWTTLNLLMYIAPVSILPVFFGFRKFGGMTVLGYYIGLIVAETLVYMDMLERNSTEALGTWAIHLAAFTVASVFAEIFAYKKRKRVREENERRRAEREEQAETLRTVAAAFAAGATVVPAQGTQTQVSATDTNAQQPVQQINQTPNDGSQLAQPSQEQQLPPQ